MPSLKSIRRRIASVKNTQKITRAMKMVAAARLRRAQQRIVELRPYAQKTVEVLRSVASGAGEASEGDEGQHPLLAHRPVKKVLYLIFTSDRGLAGAFNSSILRGVERQLREHVEAQEPVALGLVGRKGRDFFRRRRPEMVRHEFTGVYEGGAARAAEVARQLMQDFTNGDVDRVVVVYNEFKSAITQKLTFQQVLPIEAPAAAGGAPTATAHEGGHGAAGGGAAQKGGDHIFEPSREALLDRLLPMYVEVTVTRAMLESVASEQGARMTAMDSATKNAKKLIDKLTLQYNRTRQAAITKELMEIIGGAEALKD